MSEQRSWEETKAILDDPYVSADTKQAVLGAYSRDGGGFNEDAAPYFEQYNVPRYTFGSGGGLVDYLDDAAYEQAEQESEENGYQDRQVRDRLEENQGELDNAQAPGSGSSAIAKADELLDLARDGLKVFETFVPIDAEAPGDQKHIDSPLNYDEDIVKRFDEQKGIDFQKLLDEAKRLRDAHTVLSDLHSTTESSLNSLYKDWTGDGANASYQKYSEDIAPNTQELLEYLSGGADVIEATVQTVYEAVKHKADEVIAMYQSTVGAATEQTARDVMKLANGDFSSQDEILPVAAWVDAETGSDIESRIRSDDCDLNEGNKTYVIEQCKQWVRDSWNPDLYDNLHQRFTQLCDDTKEAVDTAFEEMNSYLKEYKNEFPEESAEPQPQPQPQPNPGDTGGGGGTGGGGSGGGGTGGGGTGGGGGAPSAPTPPEMETPGATTPGKNPVTGEDLEVNPETGEPYPIDPETGEAIKDTGSDQDTLTVEKGDHTFEMTEPDEDGKMEISVDDGSGELKDYKLDFGTGEEGAEGQQEGFGPQGSEGAGDEQVYRPGPDGKIHIEDGNLKITAEQPEGPDGPTKVTVDDGNPPPTTYTLGEAKQEGGGGAGAQGGTPREGIRTMPAPGENPFTSGGSEGGSFAGGGGTPAEGAAAGAPAGVAGGDGASIGGAVGGEGVAGGGDGAGGGQQTEPSAGGAGSGGGGGGGDFGGAAGAPAAVGGGGEGDALGAGAQSGAATQSAPAGAGLGVAPGGMGEPMPAAAAQGSGMSGGAGGMGMMGGMGAMGGAGGGQGGDQERSSNPYRIDGGIFEGSGGGGGSRISGSLNDDAERSIRFDR